MSCTAEVEHGARGQLAHGIRAERVIHGNITVLKFLTASGRTTPGTVTVVGTTTGETGTATRRLNPPEKEQSTARLALCHGGSAARGRSAGPLAMELPAGRPQSQVPLGPAREGAGPRSISEVQHDLQAREAAGQVRTATDGAVARWTVTDTCVHQRHAQAVAARHWAPVFLAPRTRRRWGPARSSSRYVGGARPRRVRLHLHLQHNLATRRTAALASQPSPRRDAVDDLVKPTSVIWRYA